MKKYLLAATAALLIALPLSASTRPEPGEFGIKGEWIYFYPAIDDSYFVLQGTDGLPVGEKSNNNFNYTSGYRVEGIYAFCNCLNDVRVRWTQLCKTSHEKTVIGTATAPLFSVALPPSLVPAEYAGSAFSEVSTDFYSVEALIGQVFYDCAPFLFEAEAGVHYGHVKYSEFLAYVDNATPPDEAFLTFSDTMNHGPELILDSDYALWNSDCCCPGTLHFTTSLRGLFNFSLKSSILR